MSSCISLKSKIAWNHCYCQKKQHLCISYASQSDLYDNNDDPAINSYFPGSLKTCFFSLSSFLAIPGALRVHLVNVVKPVKLVY